MFQKLVILTLTSFTQIIKTLPPSICNVPFRFEDCGKDPQAVMYYYKPGSRCEVGFWKGCVPNPNMFRDEYECASTCIMGYVQVQPKDFHSLNDIDEDYGLVTEYVPPTEKSTRLKPNKTSDSTETSSIQTTPAIITEASATEKVSETTAGGAATDAVTEKADGAATAAGGGGGAPTEAPGGGGGGGGGEATGGGGDATGGTGGTGGGDVTTAAGGEAT